MGLRRQPWAPLQAALPLLLPCLPRLLLLLGGQVLQALVKGSELAGIKAQVAAGLPEVQQAVLLARCSCCCSYCPGLLQALPLRPRSRRGGSGHGLLLLLLLLLHWGRVGPLRRSQLSRCGCSHARRAGGLRQAMLVHLIPLQEAVGRAVQAGRVSCK